VVVIDYLDIAKVLYALYAIKASVTARCGIVILDKIPESGPYTRAGDTI
jgi:hypothetical protein